jgi:hypothetical protein
MGVGGPGVAEAGGVGFVVGFVCRWGKGCERVCEEGHCGAGWGE